MITELRVANFKNFGKEQILPLAPITLIYGPNSAGKSSVLKLLALMRQSYGARHLSLPRFTPQGQMVDLGTFKSLIHNHDLKNALNVTLEYKASRKYAVRGLLPPVSSSRKVTLTFRVLDPSKKTGHIPTLERLSFNSEGQGKVPSLSVDFHFVEERNEDPESQIYKFGNTESKQSLANYLVSPRIQARVPGRRNQEPISAESIEELLSPLVWEIEGLTLTPLRQFMPMDMEIRAAGQLMDYFARELQLKLSDIRSLGPLRVQPSRYYATLESAAESVGIRGEHTPKTLSERKDLLRTIDKWFKRFDIPYKLKIRDIGDSLTGTITAMDLIDQRTDVTLSLPDVGFGIGQVLPILVEGLITTFGVICVEQPEIHLHPRLQAHLADFFIATSVKPEPRIKHPQHNQWIVETHSEALMLRMQRRIADGILSKDDVSVLYVKSTDEGFSSVQRLRLDDQGEFIDEWPDGFFEESYDEVFNS
jgi:hypothetical protein